MTWDGAWSSYSGPPLRSCTFRDASSTVDCDASSTVDCVVTSRGTLARQLAWTVTGATAGSLVRYCVYLMLPGARACINLILAAGAAGLVGFALVVSIRAPMKTVLIAGGGAASSISAVAALAASATPMQSLIGLAGFFVCAVSGVLLGMLAAFSVPRNARYEERR